MLDRLDRWLDTGSRALLALAALAGLAMMAHVTVDVFFRTALNAPLSGTNQTVAAYYMIAAAFLPIALLARRDEHIAADVFTSSLRPRTRRVFEGVSLVLGLGYMAVFTWQSWLSAMRRYGQNEVLEIPNGFLTVWPSRFLLPLAGAAMFLCLAIRLLRLFTAPKD